MTATKQPLVSICLPVFNGQPFLPAAIESLLTQTYSNFELILSDDGSDDGSLEIIAEYARADRRVRCLPPHKRYGLFGNYNHCLRAATGAFIKPFAQDDLLHVSFLEEAVQAMSKHPSVALLSTKRHAIDAEGNECDWDGLTDAKRQINKTGRIAAWQVEKASLFPVINFIGEPSAIMFASKYVGEGFDQAFNHLGDLEYWLRILKSGDYYYLDKELCYFRRHANSASHSNERMLLYAPDVVRLGRRYVGDSDDTSRQHDLFLDKNIRSIAESVSRDHAALVREPQQTEIGNNEEAFQYLLRECLLRVPDGVKQNNSYEMQRRLREMLLNNMLSSLSWCITRPLREFNRHVVAKPARRYGLRPVGDGTHFEVAQQQREYLNFLRREIARVKVSRSWKITRFLRVRK